MNAIRDTAADSPQPGQQSLDLGPGSEDPPPAASLEESDRERHLRAAWRLSRSMWRYREHSAEETRAGLAICHHLRALLEESEPRR